MMNKERCCICGGDSYAHFDIVESLTFFECESCGKFLYRIININKNFLAPFLYYNCKISSSTRNEMYVSFIGTQEEFIKIQKDNPYACLITKEDVETWYPKIFSEKIDTILLGLSKLSRYDGDMINLTQEQICSAYFVKRYNSKNSIITIEERSNQVKFIEEYLSNNRFINSNNKSINLKYLKYEAITLAPEGFKRIDELQKNQSLNSKTAFVAMSFADDMKNIKAAILKSIQNAGYIPRIMNDIEHNNQIVPEMLHEIKQSKFVVAEFTGHNNGAYYEAGYAAGLGKEVIHICRKDSFGKDGHFDVQQKATVLWETEEELTEALCRRIKATIV